MQNPFRPGRSEKPFLSPLGRQRTLPAIAAPLALTVAGGVALVVAFGTMFGIQARHVAPGAAEAERPAIVERTGTPAETQAAATAAVTPPAVEAMEPAAQPDRPSPAAPRDGSTVGLASSGAPQQPAPALRDADPDRTAAIPRAFPATAPDVPVAETDDEIAVLEDIQSEENREDLGQAAQEAADEADAAAGRAGMRPATVSSAVNMRAGPDNDAQVVKVLPARAGIDAEADCNWCKVVHEGATGYVYKSFIEYR